MVVIEAKSAALTAEALRGAPKRVRRHVEDLVVAPAQQSARLERIVALARTGDAEAAAVLDGFGIAADRIDNVVRLTVTIEDMSTIWSAEEELKAAGWAPSDLELAPACTIADLQCVTHILDGPAYLLHYLLDRSRLQRSLHVFGDEMDFLGFYLDTGFNLSTGEDKVGALAIIGMSAPIDRYFNSRDAGFPLAKPRPGTHRYFDALLSTLSARRPSGWTTMVLDLLRLATPAEQKRVARELEKLRTGVARNFRDPSHPNAFVLRPGVPRDFVGIFHVDCARNAHTRRETLSALAADAMDEHGVERCLVVSRRIEQWTSPYSFAGILKAG